MKNRLTHWRQTHASALVVAVRILLGVLFLATGVMKFAVPELRAAFSGQLIAAGIPFHALNMWVVPAVEIGLGALLLAGLLSRLASLAAIAIMVVATYVHLVVDDPTLFPLQPEEPIIPIIVIVLCLYLLWSGSSLWRLDRRVIPVER